MSCVDLKVVLLGPAAVGKTSLLERFVNERFNENLPYQNTIGAAFAAKQLDIDGRKLVMGIWDTAGNERYDAMTKIYYRGAKAAIVCYDVTKSNTFQKVKYWVRELRSVEDECKIYICATKKDILFNSDEIVTPDISTVENYAMGIQAKFFLTSSKTAELFTEIAKDFLSNPENVQKIEETLILTHVPKSSSCC